MKQKIKFITLGCSKNLVDTEHLMAQFVNPNIKITFDEKDTDFDTIVINTCGFINDAKEESINSILQHVKAKEEGLIDRVFVMGCLSERYKKMLENEIPEVDQYFGVTDLQQITKVLNQDYRKELIGERVQTTPQHFAYLKIAEGCDRTCAFCAIPNIRGKHTSVPIQQLVEEAQILVKKGVKELILISQELSYYGLDITGKRELTSLIQKLSTIEGLHWIRLHYLYPTQISDELLMEIKTNPKVCKYIDIPVQHISNSILKKMRRSHDKQHTIKLLKRIRTQLPEAIIRTTLIAGFPGETVQDFEELKDFVQQFKFDRLGVFTYSHEEDTPAFVYPDDVSEEIKQERMEEIMQIQQNISFASNQRKVGTTLKVLIDRKEEEKYIGRTEFDSPEVDNEVIISSEEELEIGAFYQVKITKADDFDLYGELQ